MKEVKYTTDGRKVVVVGSLNSQERIVQEIYVTEDGAEIPAGENFVVKSLLDQPAETYKDRSAKMLEERIRELNTKLITVDTELKKKEEQIIKPLKEKIRILQQTEKNLHPEALRLLSDFLSGSLKWAVYADYSPHIEPFTVEAQYTSSDYDKRFEKLKLISLMGSTDGKLDWMIHQYSDYSGGGKCVYLYATLEEAKGKYIELQGAKQKYSEYDLKELGKWGIEPNTEKIKEYKDRLISDARSIVNGLEAKLEEAKKTLCEAGEIKA